MQDGHREQFDVCLTFRGTAITGEKNGSGTQT
jgi:hypothetical protein